MYTTDLLKDVANAAEEHKSGVVFYRLGGSDHAENLPTENYRWGTAIVLYRNTNAVVILFPETTGNPKVNYFVQEWTGWKDFVE